MHSMRHENNEFARFYSILIIRLLDIFYSPHISCFAYNHSMLRIFEFIFKGLASVGSDIPPDAR